MGTSGTSSLPFVSHLSAFAPPRESLVPSQTIEGNTSSQLGVGRCGVPRHTKHVVGVGRASVGSFLVVITPVNTSFFPSQVVDGKVVKAGLAQRQSNGFVTCKDNENSHQFPWRLYSPSECSSPVTAYASGGYKLVFRNPKTGDVRGECVAKVVRHLLGT